MLTVFASLCLFFVCFFVLDDLIIDLYAFVKRLKPEELKPEQIRSLREIKEKRIAIVVANWHESNVIGRMISGNIRKVEYESYQFFLGVYANDPETMAAVQNLKSLYPQRVRMVVNSQNGPTSKGQMLNEIVRRVYADEEKSGQVFDIVVMHDSEDILHPLSLKLINAKMQDLDFLQIPVFSFDRPLREWVGSTYIDEFAELHTKDLIVRQHLGAALPSAGVGTALSRSLIFELMKSNSENFLRQDCLTEDYILGMTTDHSKFRSGFCCNYIRLENGKKDFVATREFFPNEVRSSIRQKTRWMIGIVFQGTQMLPFRGRLSQLYFLYRDRRGPINHLVAMMSTLLTCYCLLQKWLHGSYPDFMYTDWFFFGSVIATIGMISRFFHRTHAVFLTNSIITALSVLPRWPLGNFINFWSALRATRDFFRSKITKQPLRWVKTTHELPMGFGDE